MINGLSKYNYKIYGSDINFSYKILKSKNIIKLKFDLLKNNIPNKFNNIDIFIHNAALTKSLKITDTNKFVDCNIRLTENALKIAKKNHCKCFFLISSTSVYRNFKSEKYNERSPILGNDPYSKSKIICERICKEFCNKNKIKYSILRIGNIYNGIEKKKWSRNNVSIFQQWLNSSKRNIVLKTNSFETLRDWTYAKDIPKAINSIINNNNNFKILNLVSPFLIKDNDLMKKINPNQKFIELDHKGIKNNATISIYKNKLAFNNWTSPQRGINLIKKLDEKN